MVGRCFVWVGRSSGVALEIGVVDGDKVAVVVLVRDVYTTTCYTVIS